MNLLTSWGRSPWLSLARGFGFALKGYTARIDSACGIVSLLGDFIGNHIED
jgi:hypothetical protein